MKVIGVNGFGRIGRYFVRMMLDQQDVEVAVVNDLSDVKTLAHLLKYDSVHGVLKHAFELKENSIVFENGKRIHFCSHSNPKNIPWSDFNVELVLESTGMFRLKKDAALHLGGTVKKVILSAPAKSPGVKTVVLGVNDQLLDDSDEIVSNASCTTNSAAPMVKIIQELCAIQSAFITTVHSYTSDQRLHDAPHADLRRSRAAAQSIIPTTTGAAKAIAKIFPELEGKIGGCGVRVPVPNGSMTDMTFVVENPPTVEEINAAMQTASMGELKNVLEYTEDPIVSCDILGNPHSCIFDAQLTSVIGNMIKVVGWYDNEAGYSNRLVDLVLKMA